MAIDNPRAQSQLRDDAAEQVLAEWEERHKQAADDRRRFEPVWQMCQAFAQGHQWVGWDTHARRVVDLPNPNERVRHTVDVVSKHIWTQQGKLTADDLKPDITFRRRDKIGRSFAQHSRIAFDWGWDNEFEADSSYIDASLKRITYGLGFVRCVYDPGYGPLAERVPLDENGQVLDEEALGWLEEHGTLPSGRLPQFKQLHEGRIVFEPGGPFNTLPPPGVQHERFFPWLILERPVAISALEMAYPDTAVGLTEENLRTVDSIGLRSLSNDGTDSMLGNATLRGHVLLKTGYELPTTKSPQGRQVLWAQGRILLSRDRLPYVVNRQPKIGVSFLKYHAVDGRFWPKGLVQPMIGPQRQKNIARSQMIEVKDRISMPRVFVHENAIVEDNIPTGLPVEVIVVRQGMEFPKEVQGMPPSPAFREEADINDKDMADVSGVGEISLSQVPAGVSAYSAFALLVEQDDRRIGPIRRTDRLAVAELARCALAGMKEYWPLEKHIDVAGEDDDFMDTIAYAAADLPDMIYCKVPISAPLPQSQAAEGQKIFDLFDRSLASGQPLPIDWLDESLRTGKAQPLPKRELQVQQGLAEMENHLLVSGMMPQPQPYDNDELHVQTHRAAQQAYALMGAAVPGYEQIGMVFEQHIQMHIQSAQQKQARVAPTNNGQMPQPNQSPNQGGFGALSGAQAGGAA